VCPGVTERCSNLEIGSSGVRERERVDRLRPCRKLLGKDAGVSISIARSWELGGEATLEYAGTKDEAIEGVGEGLGDERRLDLDDRYDLHPYVRIHVNKEDKINSPESGSGDWASHPG